MYQNASTSMAAGVLHGALAAGCANVAEDGSLCFVSDRVYRTCPACGTVFIGSAWKAALSGREPCPFCGQDGTRPLVRAAVA